MALKRNLVPERSFILNGDSYESALRSSAALKCTYVDAVLLIASIWLRDILVGGRMRCIYIREGEKETKFAYEPCGRMNNHFTGI